MLKPPPPSDVPPIYDPATQHAVEEVTAVMGAHDWSGFSPATVRTIRACMVAAFLRGNLYGYRQASQDRLRARRSPA